ncbi:hypothetical protein ACA910_012376 [Epithemia clementina (nom. ined.)]
MKKTPAYEANDNDDAASVASSRGHSSNDCFIEDETSPQQHEQRNLARRETKAVCGVRFLVFGVLLCSMMAVAILVFHQLRSNETNSFEKQFREDSSKVLASLGLSIDLTLGGLDALVVNMASEAKAYNQTWPFVTIPDFAVRAQKTKSLTNALYLNVFTYVETSQRSAWENYTAVEGPTWLEETLKLQLDGGLFVEENEYKTTVDKSQLWNVLWDYGEFEKDESEWGTGYNTSAQGPFFPMWQTAPVLLSSGQPIYNWNLLSSVALDSIWAVIDTHKVSMTDAYMIAYPNETKAMEQIAFDAEWFGQYITTGEDPKEPISDIHYPILADGSSRIEMMKNEAAYDPTQHQLGGFLTAPIYWRDYIKGILPDGSNGIVAVFDNPCNPSFTYQINGPTVKYLGTGDFHETKFDYLEQKSAIHDLEKYSIRGSSYTGIPVNKDICPFTIRVYPSATMESEYITPQPVIITLVVVGIFIFTSAVFVLYDVCVEKRQRLVMSTAVRSNAILSSLFPSNVKDRLMEEEMGKQTKTVKHKQGERQAFIMPRDHYGDYDSGTNMSSKPIADLFPEATVLFADLANFTAWSSTREPTQVFFLLETLYGAFDKVARRRGVFKVETVGDCYVAVVGVPEPRKNHAVVLCRFAAEIREVMNHLTTDLELTLGPGTSDLQLRCGLHSGSVTAGVLRGEKSRFQLFGDTVNTASRIESNGLPNRIHISAKTAELLVAAGKEEWLTKRADVVVAKGKGALQTFWVEPKSRFSTSGFSATESTNSSTGDDITMPAPSIASGLGRTASFRTNNALYATDGPDAAEIDRLVDWTVSIFEPLFQKLQAHRMGLGHISAESKPSDEMPEQARAKVATDINVSPRDEVVTSIDLPSFQKVPAVDPESVTLSPIVVQQLRDYVSVIAHLYPPANPFHNFAHACHVTMSTKKLLQRITTLSNTLSQQEIYFHSFGLASDPLAEVAMIFSALIHDVDHPGVSNRQIVEEKHEMAIRYKNKSPAEQNSVNVAWSLLMDGVYADLRAFLFSSKTDSQRFRQLVVNAVMATDVFDPDLKAMRNRRWDLAFSESAQSDDPDALNRKATIVLEHLIQASDVSHTMQHWTIYQKWNRNLFREMYGAYKAGRLAKNPCEDWYNGELWFFDNYIIPLARKLKDCQVFGATSQDMLDCAYENRLEWENKGQAIAEEMREMYEQEQVAAQKDKRVQGVVECVCGSETPRNTQLGELAAA